MNYKKYGNGQIKILIIHGWLHSNKRYDKLATDLSENYEVHAVCLDGFGGSQRSCKKDVIKSYVLQLEKLINENNYSLIIGHSLGGNITLKAIERNRYIKSKLLLIAPAYHNIVVLRKHRILKAYTYLFFYFLIKMPIKLVKPLIKQIIKIGVEDSKCNDEISISDFRSADPYVVATIMIELGHDSWRVTKKLSNEIIIIEGEKDRLVYEKNINLLHSDVPNSKLITFKDCGHTPITEEYDKVLKVIYDFMGK